jgi:hypothetical protein
MYSVGSAYADVNKAQYLRSFVDLKKFIQSAKNIETDFSHLNDSIKEHTNDDADIQYTSEEILRKKILKITGSSQCNIFANRNNQYLYNIHISMWLHCVSTGALCDASLIMNRHINTADIQSNGSMTSIEFNSSLVMNAFRSIPLTIPIEKIVVWLKADILPKLYLLSNLSSIHDKNGIKSSEPGDIESGLITFLLEAELNKRSYLSATNLNQPFQAIMGAELAVTLSTLYIPPELNVNKAGTSNEGIHTNKSKNLLKNLQIQVSIWRSWGISNRPTLEDIEEIGLSGLVGERLWSLDENVIDEDIKNVISPVVNKFGGDLDEMLQSWVNDTVANSVVVIEGKVPEGKDKGNDDDTCTLSRLVHIAGFISSAQRRVATLLLLFQIPAVDHNQEEISARHKSLHRSPCDTLHEGSENDVINRLCVMAQEASLAVGPAAAEALTEAIRLHRIKSLATSYGVISFDPRDRTQIKAAANVIALKSNRVNAIKDAMEFASSWGRDSSELSSLLTRAIVHRATAMKIKTDLRQIIDKPPLSVESMDPGVGSVDPIDEGSLRDINIQDALLQVPTHRLLPVVEDACTYLIETLEELCDCSDEDSDFQAGKLSSLEYENTATMLVRSLICIASMYIDSLRSDKSNVNKNKGLLADNSSKEDQNLSKNTVSSHSSVSWVNADLISYLKRLKFLQTEKKIFLSLKGLKNMTVCKCVATYVAEEHSEIMIKNHNYLKANNGDVNDRESKDAIQVDAEGKGGQGIVTALTSDIRRVCALLCISPFVFAHIIIKKLMAKGASSLAMDVARALGAEDSTASNNSSTQIVDNNSYIGGSDTTLRGLDLVVLLEAAVTLCSLAVKQVQGGGNRSIPSIESITQPFVVSRDLLRSLTAVCPADHLGRTLDILNGSELVLTVYQRVEGAKLDTDNYRKKMNINGPDTNVKDEFKINEATFSKDGLLMAPGVILGPILKYAAAEMKRRLYMTVTNVIDSSCPIAVDLEELVGVLQRSENHMLALRVLLSSWHVSNSKAELLRSSLLALSRKVLGYRQIDTSLAVACLVMLPFDLMVRELKAAVPSIQSDFSRLRTVASVGEELSRLWEQDSLLVVFQGLQTNAKWWHILSSYGVKIDPRAFQSSDTTQRVLCIRAVVPELLERSHMDLEQAIDYCRQYDVEPEFATLTYIEKLLLQLPIGNPSGCILGANESLWARQIRRAAVNVEEKTVLNFFKTLLYKIHPLDYEKIRFVCTWIIDSFDDGMEEEERKNEKSETDESLNKYMKNKNENIAVEVESCRKYSDILIFLSGLNFPVEATKIVGEIINQKNKNENDNSDLNSSIINTVSTDLDCYMSVPSVYHPRIPFWEFLADPWLIITPLLKEVTL